MKALILAGGYARRLAPLTDFISKPLLPLGEKLVIDWVMDRISNLPVEEIIVSTNSYYEKQFKYWAKCRKEKIQLIIEPTHGENEKFGAIAGIKYAIDRAGRDDYLIIAGDNVFDFSLNDFYTFYSEKKAPVLAVYDVGDLNKAHRYGVVKIDKENRVMFMQEKPENPKSTLVSTACYIIPEKSIDYLEKYLHEKNNPDSPGYFMAWLSSVTKVYAYPFKGLWKDIGNLEEYRDAFKQFM